MYTIFCYSLHKKNFLSSFSKESIATFWGKRSRSAHSVRAQTFMGLHQANRKILKVISWGYWSFSMFEVIFHTLHRPVAVNILFVTYLACNCYISLGLFNLLNPSSTSLAKQCEGFPDLFLFQTGSTVALWYGKAAKLDSTLHGNFDKVADCCQNFS